MKNSAGFQVDVRDLAYAHVESLVREEAGNKRFGISNGMFPLCPHCLEG